VGALPYFLKRHVRILDQQPRMYATELCCTFAHFPQLQGLPVPLYAVTCAHTGLSLHQTSPASLDRHAFMSDCHRDVCVLRPFRFRGHFLLISVAVTASAVTADGTDSTTLTATVANDRNRADASRTVSGVDTLSNTSTDGAT
jgi:hypothetical protein